jgi:hypothetical protein
MKDITFDLYRYQLLPKDRYFQGDLFGEIKSIDELIQNKNKLFSEALKRVQRFKSRKTPILHKLLLEEDEFYLYRFAANRAIKIETQDFTEEEIESWPSFLVGIWNDPQKQFILVQERREAFQHSEAVVRAIVDSVDYFLSDKQLRVLSEPLFNEEAFWNIIKKHTGKVREIRFELITPNLANISNVLSDALKKFAIRTNTSRTQIDIAADPDAALSIQHEDDQIEGLVKYASDGGGDISIKVRGLKTRIHTSKSKKTIDISEIELSGNNDGIIKALKELVK